MNPVHFCAPFVLLFRLIYAMSSRLQCVQCALPLLSMWWVGKTACSATSVCNQVTGSALASVDPEDIFQ